MGWGITDTAPLKEKIKAEFNDEIKGLNSVGAIDYITYSKLFDIIMPLFDKMFDAGRKEQYIELLNKKENNEE